MSEPHPVVELLVARMESHPEEFRVADGRWAQWLDELIPFVTEAERLLLREPMMQEIHERVMDELLNGDDRRRREEEETEYERQMVMQGKLAQQQMAQQMAQQKAQQATLNAYGQYNQASGTALLGHSPSNVCLDKKYANISVASQIEPTLSSSTISQIKKALGL